MKKLIVILIATVLLFSCKTTRYNVKETTKSNIEIQTDMQEDVKVVEEVKTLDIISQLTDELTTIIERIIATKLSAPDSLGVQYPTEIITTEREITRQKAESRKQKVEVETERKIQVNKTENSKQVINTETEKIDKTVVKKTTPGWVLAGTITLCVGILLLIFLILKKYRVL